MPASQPNLPLNKSYLRKTSSIAVLTITLSSMVVAALLVCYGCIRFFQWATPSASVAPTSIPWLKSQSDCQETGRSWQKGQCWDRSHDRLF
ncbi:MAG: hypothetical protein ACRC8A_20165 [Microcoleaceae cyanobacterium]